MTANRCASCLHWTPIDLAVSDDGACSRVGVSVHLYSRHVVLDGNILPYGEEAPTLVTPAQFGCVRWDGES